MTKSGDLVDVCALVALLVVLWSLGLGVMRAFDWFILGVKF